MKINLQAALDRFTDKWPRVRSVAHPVLDFALSLQYRRPRLDQIAWVPSLINPRHAFRFLWAGLTLIVLVCLIGVVAINTNTGLLYLLVGLMLGAWIVSGVFSTINLAGLSITRDVARASQVGETLSITYTLTNNKRFFWSYSLTIEELGHLPIRLPSGYAISIRPGMNRRCAVQTLCRRRGYMRLRRIRVSSRFPFGLIAKCVVLDAAADVVVQPSIGHVRFELLHSASASAGVLGQYNQQTKGFEEFYGIREFQNYDNFHWIHWRSAAKHSKLMVKEMAEYNSNQLTILLDTRVEDPLSLPQQQMLEEAISFAATLVDRATERCLPVALVVSGGDMKVVKHGRGAGHRWSLMTELAGVRMGSWSAALPSLDGFHPRSFVDSHYWVIGVGVSKHMVPIGRSGRSVTVIDVQSDRFTRLFRNESLAALAAAASGQST